MKEKNREAFLRAIGLSFVAVSALSVRSARTVVETKLL